MNVVLPDENREDFDEILAGLQAQYQPQNQPSGTWSTRRGAAPQGPRRHVRPYDASPMPPGARLLHCKELERIKAAREKQAEQSKQPERERKERMSHLPSSSPLPGGEWQAREGVQRRIIVLQPTGCAANQTAQINRRRATRELVSPRLRVKHRRAARPPRFTLPDKQL